MVCIIIKFEPWLVNISSNITKIKKYNSPYQCFIAKWDHNSIKTNIIEIKQWCELARSYYWTKRSYEYNPKTEIITNSKSSITLRINP